MADEQCRVQNTVGESVNIMRFNIKFFRKILPIITLLTIFVVPLELYAQEEQGTSKNVQVEAEGNSKSTTFTLSNPLKVDSVGGLIQNFVDIFSYIVILGAVLTIIWVGLQFILASGNPDRLKELKKWLLGILCGVAVVIGARIIIDIVINTLASTGVVNQSTIQAVKKANP